MYKIGDDDKVQLILCHYHDAKHYVVDVLGKRLDELPIKPHTGTRVKSPECERHCCRPC